MRITSYYDWQLSPERRAAREERECQLALFACVKAARDGRMAFSQVRYARRDLAAARKEPEGWWSR